MGNQTSETHEQYRAQPGLSEPKEFNPNYPNFTYKDHLSNGPTKVCLIIQYSLNMFVLVIK